jgi:hypothetical protein
LPMPREAPVTTAILPPNENACLLIQSPHLSDNQYT